MKEQQNEASEEWVKEYMKQHGLPLKFMNSSFLSGLANGLIAANNLHASAGSPLFVSENVLKQVTIITNYLKYRSVVVKNILDKKV